MGLLQLLSGHPLVSGAVLIWIAAMLWIIYKDAEARDAQPGLWAIGLGVAAVMLPLIGLVIGVILYWFVRPKGRLLRCPHCASRHLDWLAQCPKCRGPLKRDCHRCRAVVDYSFATCPHCHARL